VRLDPVWADLCHDRPKAGQSPQRRKKENKDIMYKFERVEAMKVYMYVNCNE
jgi:hypothetical protein